MNKKLKKLYKNLSEYEEKTIRYLRRTRKPLYTVLRDVSRSGMTRKIDVYMIKNNKPIYLTHLISKIADYNTDKNGRLIVKGCGMDMGFDVVYNFSRRIFPNGFKYRKNEPHRNNTEADRDNDGGYALKQKWI